MGMATALRRFTVDEVERMVRAGILHEDDRVELLDGQLVEMSPANPPHASCVKRLGRLFASLSASDRSTLSIQDPIVLSEHQAPQPDVALLRYRADGYRTRNPGPADTLLVIEVGDSSAQSDRERKIPLYAGAGVLEAWLANLPGDALEVYRTPRDGRYVDVRMARRGDTIAPLAFPDLALRVEEILG
jgi:Uma2 family endonuclease